MMSNSKENIEEDSFSSDVEFDEEEENSDSETDVEAKLAEDDVFDIEFFKCYSALKKKDDKIYDKNVKFFDEEDITSDDEKDVQDGTKKSRNGPKMTLLDHQLNLVNNDDNEEKSKVDLNEEVSKSYYEKELEEIKKSIEEVGKNVDSDDEDDFLVVKESKDKVETSRPKKKIKEMLDKLEAQEDEDISHLKEIWTDPDKLNHEDKFLRDYIVNKLYLPQNVDGNDEQEDNHFFSKNLDDLSDADDDREAGDKRKKHKVDHHSEEKDFDKITRIPRNSTKTIRDLVEKKDKKEKRLKALEKKKKKKKALKDAECEDIVGDLPTKFHYRETEPNDYGLSAEELLMATDEELEKWCKLKDAIAYKSIEEELEEKNKYEKRRNDIELKKKIFISIYESPEENERDETEVPKNKPDKGKKRKRKYSDEPTVPTKDPQDEVEIPKKDDVSKKKKKHKRGLNHKKFAKAGVAPDRLLAYGLSKNKLRKSKLL